MHCRRWQHLSMICCCNRMIFLTAVKGKNDRNKTQQHFWHHSEPLFEPLGHLHPPVFLCVLVFLLAALHLLKCLDEIWEKWRKKKNKDTGRTVFYPKPLDSNLKGDTSLSIQSSHINVRLLLIICFIGTPIQLVFIYHEYDAEQWPLKRLQLSS